MPVGRCHSRSTTSGPAARSISLRELRPDAGQHRHRREQPVENGGTHRSIYGLPRCRADVAAAAWLYRGTMPAPSIRTETPGDIRRKRLLFRSWHRGTREADLILGSFAEAYLAGFDEDAARRIRIAARLPRRRTVRLDRRPRRAAARIRQRGDPPAARLPLHPARDVRRRNWFGSPRFGAIDRLARNGLAAARAADERDAGHRVSPHRVGRQGFAPQVAAFDRGTERNRLCLRAERSDRISLGRGPTTIDCRALAG